MTEIRKLLETFSAISLREKSSAKIMDEHGIQNCKFVLDPTFLFSRAQWKNYEKEVVGCPEKYLLIYFLDTRGEDIVKLAKKIAVAKGLHTVLIRPVYSKIDYGVDLVVSDATPDKYIWLFRHASFVVTNSFHPPLIEKPVNQKFSLHQMEHYQKFYENGEYVRAVESTTEQNYNMIDGCANNLPKPRIINGRESVLDKLRIRQMAREKQKSGQMQEQSTDIERNRK